MKWFLYIVECKDQSLYTGITTDLVRRVNEHNLGVGAKSLRGKRPVKLVYSEIYDTRSDAHKRENTIKSWKREYKLRLISQNKSSS